MNDGEKLSRTGRFASKAPYIIAALAVLCCLGEWTMASSIGPARIFTPNRATKRADFIAFTQKIDRLIQHQCEDDGARWIIFKDIDVVTPYVIDRIEAERKAGRCVVLRPTDVTPLRTLPNADKCATVLVQEWFRYPISGRPKPLYGGLATSLTPDEPSSWGEGMRPWFGDPQAWRVVEHWSSSTGTDNYAAYRRQGCEGDAK